MLALFNLKYICAALSVFSVSPSISWAFPTNTTPAWKSYQVTGNPNDIVSSPTVAAAIGAKVDASYGQALGITLQGGVETVLPSAGDNGTSIAPTQYVDRAVSNGFSSIKNDPSLIGFQTAASSTINVCTSGCTYSHISDAWSAAISQAHKLNGSNTITIQIADGTYNETSNVYTTDPMGKFIRIIGDTSDYTKVVLNYTGTKGTNFTAFAAYNGGKIGYIDGVSIVQPIDGTGARNSVDSSGRFIWNSQSYGSGIMAYGAGSNIVLGPHMYIAYFYYGVVADNNGGIDAPSGGVTVAVSGDANFMARGGGVIVCTPCTARSVSDYTDSTNPLGSNYIAERGGSLYIDGSTGKWSLSNCVLALTNGAAWAHATTCTGGLNTGGNAYASWEGGTMELAGSTASGGYTNGANVSGGGFISVDKSTFTANQIGLLADGGIIQGSTVTVTNNTTYGAQAIHQGRITAYTSYSLLSGNATNFSVQAAGTNSTSSTAYTASSIDYN